MNLFFSGLTAFGTIAVAILAIWGEWIRVRIAGPKLRLEPHHDFHGVPLEFKDGKKAFYYHLNVVNERNWSRGNNCQVLLKKLWERRPDGKFHEIWPAVPLNFVWAPSGFAPALVTIKNEHVLDFGTISDSAEYFRPCLYTYTNEFRGYVRANCAIRYGLEIVCDEFVSPKLYKLRCHGTGSGVKAVRKWRRI